MTYPTLFRLCNLFVGKEIYWITLGGGCRMDRSKCISNKYAKKKTCAFEQCWIHFALNDFPFRPIILISQQLIKFLFTKLDFTWNRPPQMRSQENVTWLPKRTSYGRIRNLNLDSWIYFTDHNYEACPKF